MVLTLVEEARARVEACLGWAMLIRIHLCCKHPLTLVTQRQLAKELRLDWPLSPAVNWNNITTYVKRLVLLHLGPVRALANRIPATPFPVISRRAGGFLGPETLRRVRVEHITRWSRPSGRRHHWQDLRAPFRTRGFDVVAQSTEAEGDVGPPECWRQVTRRQLIDEVYAELIATTARFLWHGFQLELVEQTMDWYEYSDSDCDSSDEETPTSSRSRSRSARRQQ